MVAAHNSPRVIDRCRNYSNSGFAAGLFGHMRRVVFRVLCVVALLCICCFWCSAQELDFSGAVKNGETFRKDIGHGLVFVLAPLAGGYQISIEPLRGGNPNNNDFTACVTPPFHGPNPTFLLPRDFRDEHGNLLPAKVLAGLKNREFSFVLSAADQDRACNELSEAMYGPEKKDKKGNPVFGFLDYKQPPLGKGVFDIFDFQVSGPEQSEQFQSITFAVHIEFPKPARKSKQR